MFTIRVILQTLKGIKNLVSVTQNVIGLEFAFSMFSSNNCVLLYDLK